MRSSHRCRVVEQINPIEVRDGAGMSTVLIVVIVVVVVALIALAVLIPRMRQRAEVR